MSAKGNDFQNTNFIFIINDKNQLPHPRGTWVTDKNIIEILANNILLKYSGDQLKLKKIKYCI